MFVRVSRRRYTARAMEFYLAYLGFRVDWEHRFEAELPAVQ
jgi:hypothetical protein